MTGSGPSGCFARSSTSLSVVVIVLAGREALGRCLRALAAQVGPISPEVVVPCDEKLEGLSQLRREFPHVRFLPVPGHRTFAELRAVGFEQARGEIVALTEDHCSPDPDWCATIVAMHTGPLAAVGGAVDKEGPDGLLNWAIYLCDFSRYANPLPEGPSAYLTDCNVSYKRAKLAAIADLWAAEFHETTVNWALLGQGETLWLSPRIIVRQQRSLRFGAAIRERYAFGRLFASTRVRAITAPRRVLYACASIVLPAILLQRLARNVFKKRLHVGVFLKALPYVVVLNVVWAWGECLGYLTGQSAPVLTPGTERARASSRRTPSAATNESWRG